jgi:hypothetical protein
MSDTLFQAYTPLLFWTGLGILLFRFLPETLPRYLGRSLYWVGVPIQIFTLARQTDFADRIGLSRQLLWSNSAPGHAVWVAATDS